MASMIQLYNNAGHWGSYTLKSFDVVFVPEHSYASAAGKSNIVPDLLLFQPSFSSSSMPVGIDVNVGAST